MSDSLFGRVREFVFPSVWTWRERVFRVVLYALVVLVLVGVGGLVLDRSWRITPVFWTVGLGAFLAFAVRSALERQHLAALAELRRLKFTVCPACRRDLSGPACECTSCGERYDLGDLRRKWTYRYIDALRWIAIYDEEPPEPSD